MDDRIGRTRLFMQTGTNYLVTEDVDAVIDKLREADQADVVEFMSVTGQAAMPPERLYVRVGHISTVQECSLAGWIWQQRAAELHYARQIEDTSPMDRYTEVAKDLVETLKGHEDE